jgi:serine/threonine protein kinase
MAKCISTMHGFENGPIVHVDVQAGQFFRGRDGLIKLVDYNRAEALLYDVKQDKYCNWINGPPAEGMFRAPEENIDAPLTEKIDVYSLGNVFYSVLTGIMVFNNVSSEEAHRRIVEGETEPIADFYYNEPNLAALAEAIEMCWTYDVEERPSIFEVVQFLEQAVKVNKR